MEEIEIADNRAFVHVRIVPRDRVAVFPNPFLRSRDGFARFFVPEYSRLRIFDPQGALVWGGAGGVGQRRAAGRDPLDGRQRRRPPPRLGGLPSTSCAASRAACSSGARSPCSGRGEGMRARPSGRWLLGAAAAASLGLAAAAAGDTSRLSAEARGRLGAARGGRPRKPCPDGFTGGAAPHYCAHAPGGGRGGGDPERRSLRRPPAGPGPAAALPRPRGRLALRPLPRPLRHRGAGRRRPRRRRRQRPSRLRGPGDDPGRQRLAGSDSRNSATGNRPGTTARGGGDEDRHLPDRPGPLEPLRPSPIPCRTRSADPASWRSRTTSRTPSSAGPASARGTAAAAASDALRVTLAHEFFHVVQFGYYQGLDGSWWQEATATWMEDVIHPGG